MSVKIRLARGGAKDTPFYRIVVACTRAPRDGAFLEKLGTYNPMLTQDNPLRVVLNVERIEHWLASGAVPSMTVLRLIKQKCALPSFVQAQLEKEEKLIARRIAKRSATTQSEAAAASA
ncbi:30S ribosomal protein S16 [Rickettsiales endosymbiont of Paramecium tredecaurelia]|uniref:30S ribosomal protein S16 n=1 Tax=Candidatus Sarmatiella mevalonica TaxID=2770581 RepID=UPI001923267F|nr:30S ribosomal protein S16 [Candidatus Sarmatiella mevalonica]MBL3284684.1 30S ribosomal protein S16 [Candidatus Sarmatiella mevalonica]